MTYGHSAPCGDRPLMLSKRTHLMDREQSSSRMWQKTYNILLVLRFMNKLRSVVQMTIVLISVSFPKICPKTFDFVSNPRYCQHLMSTIQQGVVGSAGKVANQIDQVIADASELFGVPQDHRHMEEARHLVLQARTEEAQVKRTAVKRRLSGSVVSFHCLGWFSTCFQGFPWSLYFIFEAQESRKEMTLAGLWKSWPKTPKELQSEQVEKKQRMETKGSDHFQVAGCASRCVDWMIGGPG